MDIKPIPGYPKYTISTDGTVTSYWKKTPRAMKLHINDAGYLCVRLTRCEDGKRKSKIHRVHRLLAQCFLPTWDSSLLVDHIDRDRSNNDLSNLRMVGRLMNNRNTNSKGVWLDRKRKEKGYKNFWEAFITVDYRRKNLGRYPTEEEARAAYVAAKLKYHGVVLDS